jgi:hypothetical protein
MASTSDDQKLVSSYQTALNNAQRNLASQQNVLTALQDKADEALTTAQLLPEGSDARTRAQANADSYITQVQNQQKMVDAAQSNVEYHQANLEEAKRTLQTDTQEEAEKTADNADETKTESKKTDAETEKSGENEKKDDETSGDEADNPSTPAQASGTADTSASDDPQVKGGQKGGGQKSEPPDANQSKLKPKINPLSTMSSYTYGLSLYMVTTQAMNKFVTNGGRLSGIKGRNSGVYVVAQSGGVNNNIEDRLLTIDKTLGTGKEGFDYYIDDLQLTTFLPGGESRATVSTDIKFKIYEPSSFTFLRDISKASAELNAKDPNFRGSADGETANGFTQHFILSIRFFGYDIHGDQKFDGIDFSDYGLSEANPILERSFAIKITSMKFKLDGKMVCYSVEAKILSEQVGYGRINGTISKQMTLTGGTVGEVLNGVGKGINSLTAAINSERADMKDREQIDVPNEIYIEFLDSNGKRVDAGEIETSGLMNDTTFVAETAPLGLAKTSDEITIKDSVTASGGMDTKKKNIAIAAGQNILTVIDNIIVKSNYVTNALKKVADQTVTPDNHKKTVTAPLKWYTINPIVKINKVDAKTNMWSYNIIYQVRPYNIPYVKTNVAGLVSKFPGAYKRYDYWLTGKNSEILSYSQEYDNLFYTEFSVSTDVDKNTQQKAKIPNAPAGGVNSESSGAMNKGGKYNDDVRAQLYSPSDQTHAKIKILGDPDYIMSATGVNGVSMKQFFNQDGSISPHNGQVFIEIKFNTVSDYGSDGVMDVSDQLQFYQSKRVKQVGIDGIVYMVKQVDSHFVRGSFTQQLDCWMTIEDLLVSGEEDPSGDDSSDSRASRGDGKGANSGASGTKTVTNDTESGRATSTSADGVNQAGDKATTEVRAETQGDETIAPPEVATTDSDTTDGSESSQQAASPATDDEVVAYNEPDNSTDEYDNENYA